MSHHRAFPRFTWRPTRSSWTAQWARKSLFILAILAIATGLLVHASGTAFAYGTCGPSTQTTKLQYTNAGCIYTNPVWFSQGSQQYAHIKLVFNGVESKLVQDFTTGANSWTKAGGHVDFSTSCSNCGNNVVTVIQIDDCTQHWWGQGDSGTHKVQLNKCYDTGSDAIWQGISAHELGHTMGLAHNRWNNGGALMFGCDFDGQFSDCSIHVTTPQAVDVDILNTIFPVYSTLCSLVPNDENCNNQDYQVQSCNAYPQSPRASDAFLTVTLFYSTNCQSNWTWAVLTGGYQLFHVEILRGGNSVDVALNLTETPPDHTTTWYTNMIWAPSNPAMACAWYVQYGSPHIYGPVCTTWH